MRKFIDTAVLRVQAGSGGHGCVSFRREKFVPHGGPDGGDGGNGGDVYLRGSQDVASLIAYFYAPDQSAERGGHGKGKKLYGRNGKDLILDVPLGTEVHHGETGELLGDIVEQGQLLCVAKGGRGGLGNPHWKTSTHQAPREHTDGKPGEAVDLKLILKLMADVGLVGFPNAGKSSLLTRISDAHPKIGAYPFTTLNPIIGTLIFEDYTRMTMADIPGLIQGAHQGIGLGHAFLRHIERAPYLIYVIDMAGADQRVPHEDYTSLREELQLHMEGLAERPSMVVANKMDLPEAADNLAEFKKETGTDPICISAETGMGVDELKQLIESEWNRPAG